MESLSDYEIARLVRSASRQLQLASFTTKIILPQLNDTIKIAKCKLSDLWRLVEMMLGNDVVSGSEIAVVSLVEHFKKIANPRSIMPLQYLMASQLDATCVSERVWSLGTELGLWPSKKFVRTTISNLVKIIPPQRQEATGIEIRVHVIDGTHVTQQQSGLASNMLSVLVGLERVIDLSATGVNNAAVKMDNRFTSLMTSNSVKRAATDFLVFHGTNPATRTNWLHQFVRSIDGSDTCILSYDEQEPIVSRKQYIGKPVVSYRLNQDTKSSDNILSYVKDIRRNTPDDEITVMIGDQETWQFLRKLENLGVVPVFGVWHAEYHVLNAIFHVWGDTILEPIAQKLNLRSYYKMDSNGKKFVVFRIFKKFILSLVRLILQCVQHQFDVAKCDFTTLLEKAKSENYRYYVFLQFAILAGVPYVMWTRSVRSNNFSTWRQAFASFLPHFTISGKNKYVNILISFEVMYQRASESLRTILQRCIAFPATEHSKYFSGNDDNIEQVRPEATRILHLFPVPVIVMFLMSS